MQPRRAAASYLPPGVTVVQVSVPAVIGRGVSADQVADRRADLQRAVRALAVGVRREADVLDAAGGRRDALVTGVGFQEEAGFLVTGIALHRAAVVTRALNFTDGVNAPPGHGLRRGRDDGHVAAAHAVTAASPASSQSV